MAEPINPRILFVSTYPPTRCGIATFTNSLVDAISLIRGERRSIGVFRLLPPGDNSVCLDSEVVAEVSPLGWIDPAEVLWNSYDLMWIQHEFGIFGPEDGRAVVDLCQASRLPIVVTLHTVPAEPSTDQRGILKGLVARAESAVVMSHSAKDRLATGYLVDRRKVRVIPHGAPVFRRRPGPELPAQRTTIVSWGLVGPGKGIEWSIQAMDRLRHLQPRPRLIVRGVTHPNVKRREGETYRDQLQELINRLDLNDIVELKDGYMSAAELRSFIQQGDIALLPYDSEEQVTSGVLVEAIAAGLPVVATAFPHAVELLANGAGSVVPHRDPDAIARVLERYLTDRQALSAASAAASRAGKQLTWPWVATAYDRLARQVVVSQSSSVA